VAEKFDPAKWEKLENPDRLTELPPGVVIEMLAVDGSETVVDFGAGTGMYTIPIAEATPRTLVDMMFGDTQVQRRPDNLPVADEVVLQVEHLTRGQKFQDVSFSLRKGEILGIAGMLGAGRSELLRSIFGADPVDSGRILVHGTPVTRPEIPAMKALGLAMEKDARFLLASTSEIYGDPLVHPQTEDYWGNVNTIGPRGCYDEAKRFAEALTMAYHREHKVETRIVRIFNTYGPRMRLNDGRVVPAFISQALKNKPVTVFGRGRQTRSFCYVSDLIEGIYRLMMSRCHLPVNLGNPTEMTMLQFAAQIIRATRSHSKMVFKPLPQDDPKQRRPDITRARKILKWEPKVPLAGGLAKTIEYFRAKV